MSNVPFPYLCSLPIIISFITNEDSFYIHWSSFYNTKSIEFTVRNRQRNFFDHQKIACNNRFWFNNNFRNMEKDMAEKNEWKTMFCVYYKGIDIRNFRYNESPILIFFHHYRITESLVNYIVYLPHFHRYNGKS